MPRLPNTACSSAKGTSLQKREEDFLEVFNTYDTNLMNASRSLQSNDGLKYRKLKNNGTNDGVHNGYQETEEIENPSFCPVVDSEIAKVYESENVQLEAAQDVCKKQNRHGELPYTSENYVKSTTTPKRHHTSVPTSRPTVADIVTIEANANPSSLKFEMAHAATDPAVSEATHSPESGLGCDGTEKSSTDCDMSVVTPMDEEIAASGDYQLQQAHKHQVATGPIYSGTSSRSASLLPRPGNVGTTSTNNSSRHKTTSKSKRHSSRTNLYIRGLPKSMSENDLVSLVPDASSIRSVKLVVNNDGEGYGFIDFVSNETAVLAMQHIKHQNSSQYVNFAYESEKDPLNIYVTNIPESWNSDNVENLKQIFSPYGKITSALVMTRRSTNTCIGTGFVRYLTSDEAQQAIEGIRKAKIILPGATRPLELKLADRQKARDHKGDPVNSECGVLPLFQQFICDDASTQLTPALKTHQQQQNQIIEDIFNTAFERSIFDSAKMAAANAAAVYGPPSMGQLASPISVDITSTSADEMSASGKSHLSAMPVTQAVAVANAASLAAPIYPIQCIPWFQKDPTVAGHVNAAAAYMNPHLALTMAHKPPTSQLQLNSLAAACQMASLVGLNYAPPQPSPVQPYDVMLPFLNAQLTGQPIETGVLPPFGVNQPLWPKTCYYG